MNKTETLCEEKQYGEENEHCSLFFRSICITDLSLLTVIG